MIRKLVAALMLMPMMALATMWYVNGSTGSDSNSGTSESAPKATIQAAVDASSAGDTIFVAPGTYAPFLTDNKMIVVLSMTGADNTIIDGGGSYERSNTLVVGYDNFANRTTNTVVQGFTIQNLTQILGGTIRKCIVRNNDCSSIGCAACTSSVVEDCLILNNKGMNGAAGGGSILRNCTIVGNTARDLTYVCLNSVLENCIVYGNGNDERGTLQAWLDSDDYIVTSVGHREGNVYVGDPGFVDAANGDYRLAAGSPCIDAGNNAYVTMTTDLAGNARIANGTVDIGCYEYGSSTVGGATWYVNGSTGSDSNSGTSESAPKATIQAAIDASAAGDTILVAAGTYAPIVTENKAITIKSISGSVVTIIDGDNSQQCAILGVEAGDRATVLDGFTICKGYTSSNYGAGVYCGTIKNCLIHSCTNTFRIFGSGGGGVYEALVEDCTFENNCATHGAGLFGGIAYRSVFRNNYAYDDGGAMKHSTAYDCLIVNNYTQNWGGLGSGAAGADVTNYNCTVVNNHASSGGIFAGQSVLVNCIVTDNTWDSDTLTYEDSEQHTSMVNCYADSPYFIDAANGDYRLAAGSPCIDAGDNSYVTTTTDLAGNARIANGRVDIGCYEYGSSGGDSLTDGLVAYYPFDGNANDASGNGHFLNTSDIGVTLTEDRNSNANHAYYFDGTGTFYPNSMWKFEGSGTYSFWVKPEGNIGNFYPEGGDGYGQSPFVIFPLWGSGPAEGYSFSGIAGVGVSVGRNGIMVHEHAHRYLSTTLSYQSELGSDWVNVVVTIEDNGAPKLFLNGELVRTGITTEYTKAFGFAAQIPVAYEQLDGASGQDGVGGGCYGHFKGALDDLRIYNRALSAAEVKALYNGTEVTPSDPVVYTVTFDLNGADGAEPAERQIAEGAVVGELPTVSRTGYTCLGWFTAASGGTQVSASTTVTGNVTYYAQWRINSYTATFDANGGTGGTTKTQDYGTSLTAPTVTREGYTFTGWSPSVPSTVPASDATYTAQWRINSYTVSFDAQGGAGGGTVARNHGAALGELPVPTRDGFSFDGWFTAASGGSVVSSATVITGVVTFYAHWTEVALYPTPVWYDEDGEEIDWTRYYDGDEEPFAAESAATFNGYVLDGEVVCGIVQVKVGKANKRTATSKVTASLTLLGETKKRSYKGTMSKRGIAELKCSGKGNLSLCLGTNAMWGEVGGLSVSGARNVFAKAGDPKAAVLSKWQGAFSLVLQTVDAEGAGSAFAWGYSGLTVTVGAKGKVKVQGTMVDGSKVNVSSQLLVGERRCCIPVVVPLYMKKGGFAFNLWLQNDGTIEVGEMGTWDATASKTPFMALFGEEVPVARVGASLPSSLSFLFLGEPDLSGMEALYDFLPWEVAFTTGSRWSVPAAGNVKYDREEETYVDVKDSSNPAGLKLTYVAKTGAFKGSFKLYATDASGRLKKLTANVSGVMVGRQGYGTATVKGVGSWPVAIQ